MAPFHEIATEAVPDFYRQLAAAPDGVTGLVEAPWTLEWPLALPADYQAIHGLPVQVWTGFWTFRAPGVRLESHIATPGGVPDWGTAEIVVVHLDWVEEWRAVTGGPNSMPAERLAEAAERYRIDARALDAWLAEQSDWRLAYEDAWLHVYRRH